MALKVSIVEYPFEGEIYRTFIDDSKPLEEQVEEKVVVLKTKCDIQAASSYNRGNFINATYNIYMPFDTNKTINFKRGDLFESNAYGMVVNGEIIGIYPSQLGGISLFIKDIDVLRMAKKGSDDILNRLINELTKAGEKAIHLAYNTRDYKNQLFNLRDSYGSAVYYNGQLQKRTIRYLGPEMGTSKSGLPTNWVWDKPRSMPDWRGERRITGDYIQMRGRDEIMDFFERYKPATNALHLVVVAAMWYANVLEKGGGNLKRKYKVISGAKDVMQMVQRELGFGTLLIEIDEKRDMNRMPSIKGTDWKH